MTPTRLQAKGWARVGKPGAHLLRRGAWYPVVRISSSHIVVLDVNRRNVPVDRRFLEIRYHPPERWSAASRVRFNASGGCSRSPTPCVPRAAIGRRSNRM